MEIKFIGAREIEINDARLIFRNFGGTNGFKPGQRGFSVVIPDQEIADELIARGWEVKIKPPRVEGEDPFMHLPVKVNYRPDKPNLNPTALLKSGGRMRDLSEDEIYILDNVDIVRADLDLNLSVWSEGTVKLVGREGSSAFLGGIKVTQRMNRFAEEYDRYLAENEPPFAE